MTFIILIITIIHGMNFLRSLEKIIKGYIFIHNSSTENSSTGCNSPKEYFLYRKGSTNTVVLGKNLLQKAFNSCNLCPRGRCHAWLDDPKFLSAYWETRIIALPNDGLQKAHSTDFSGPRDASGSSGYGGQSTSGSSRGSKPSRSGSVYGSSQGSSSSTVPKWFRGTTGKDHRK